MPQPSDIARAVAAEQAYGPIYSAQNSDSGKAARANEMARRLGLPPDIVEADFPNMQAEDRLRRAAAQAQQTPAYAAMMANPRFAAAAIDDQSLHPLASALTQHVQQQEGRPASGWRGMLNAAATALSPIFPGLAAVPDIGAPRPGAGSYLGSSALSGLHSAAAVLAQLPRNLYLYSTPQGAIERTTDQILAAVAPREAIRLQVAREQSDPLHQLAMAEQRRAVAAQKGMSAAAKANYAGLTYATMDGDKAAYASPVRLLGDTINSLPTTAALALTAYLTRGASLRAEAAAIAEGVGATEARALGVKAAEKMAALFGAGSEGAAGGTQQQLQTQAQLEDQAKWETSPEYQALTKGGIDPATAKLFLASRAGRMAGGGAAAVDALTNLLGGPVLGKIIGEGGSLVPRFMKGAATEGVTESVQSAGEQVAQNLAVKENADPHQALLQGVMENAIQGLAVGGLTGGGVSAAFGHNIEQAHAAETAANVDRIMTAAAQSQTRTANPSDFEATLHQLLDGRPGENIYVPAETVQSLFQNESIRDDAFWGQYADQVDEAAAIGGDVVLPLATAATHLAGSDQWTALRDHVRATPGGLSLAEAKQQQSPEEMEAAANRLSEHIDRQVPHLEAGREAEKFVAKLGLEGAEATSASRLLAANLAVATVNENAKRAARGEDPITPAQMFKSWNLKAEKTTQAAFEAMGKKGALEQAARGNISISKNADLDRTGAVIRTFESANFSTFVHEMGHFWVEDLRARARASDATEAEKADWEAVKGWFGENGHQLGKKAAIPTEAHEMWARGMERYVYEGKAPSRGLKALFARMRDWMMDLYRTVAAFNSPITPEIRGVMDRLFASDEEIAQARADMALASGNLAGLMTKAEQAEYQKLGDDARNDAREALYERVLSALRQEKTKEASARTKEIRDAVTEAVDVIPAFAALKLLRSGVPGENGETIRVRIPRQWLVDNYGEDILDQLPKGIQPVYADTDTIEPESLAEMAGFDSADQMVKDLVAMEAQRHADKAAGDKRSPRQKAIEEETDARVRAEIGDPMANIEEEARAALASERQADLMSMELRALARKTGQRPTAWKMATAWAAQHIAGQRYRDAITGSAVQMYARNAGKAGRGAEEALIKGDFAEAFRFKQQQLLNLALLSEAKKAKDNVGAAVRRLQSIASKATIKSVDQDYLDQAHQLLENVDLKTRPLSKVDKRQAFEKWYADQVAQGIEPVVPPEYQRILGATNWQQLPISELIELDEVVGQIMALGRLKQKIRDGRDIRDFNEVVANLQETAEAGLQRKRTAANDPSRVLTERVKSGIRAFDAALIKMETIIDWLDNGNPNGPWNRAFMWVASEAQGKEADLTRQYAAEINDLIKQVPRAQARRWTRWVDTPELVNNIPGHPERGTPMKFGMDQIVMMAANWGNEGNRQRLVDGFGWDEGTVKSVLDRLMTKEDWDFVHGVWRTIDKLWPSVAEMERRVNGVAPEKVEGVQVETPFGTYQGGYFPVVYDTNYSTAAQLQAEDKVSPHGGFFRTTARAGSTHERVAAVKGRPLLLDLGVITRHMREVIHDVTHREAIKQMSRLLSSNRVRTAVNNALGPEYLKTMESVVDNMARPGQANSKSHPALVWIARRLNRGVSQVGLGFRLSTILQQPLGITNMMGVVGERAVMDGLMTSIAHPVRTYNEVIERSAEMRHRFQNMDATIHAQWEEHRRGKLALIGPGAIEKAAFQGIAFTDALITTGGWIGAYNKALREGMSEDEAVHYADKIIRTSQGAGGAKDQAPVQFDHAFVKAFVPFFSYLNANYNQRRDVGHRLRRVEGAGDAAEAARRYWWVAVAPSLAMALLFGKGPDDKTDEGWLHYLSMSVVLGGIQTIPFVGNVANALGQGYGYRATPWQQFGENIVKSAKDLTAATDANDETQVSGSWIKNALYVAGVVTAKPLGQLGTTAQGVHDYATGQADPHGVRDWYSLLSSGRVPQTAQ